MGAAACRWLPRPVGGRQQIRFAALLGAVLLGGTVGVAAQNATQDRHPPADIIAKANELKDASSAYLNAKCGGAGSDKQAKARSLRDGLREQLSELIAGNVSRLPEVQGALDAATDAGEAASKAAGDSAASEQDKAAAQAKFQIARGYLNDVAKTARERIEAQLSSDAGLTLAAISDDCPETRKKAQRKPPEKRHVTTSQRRSSPGSESQAPSIGVGVGVGGGGGIGIGGGGVGISIGR